MRSWCSTNWERWLINNHAEIYQVADCSQHRNPPPAGDCAHTNTQIAQAAALGTNSSSTIKVPEQHKHSKVCPQKYIFYKPNGYTCRLLDTSLSSFYTSPCCTEETTQGRSSTNDACYQLNFYKYAWKMAIRNITSLWSKNSKTHCYHNPHGLWDKATQDVLLHSDTAATSYMCP